MTFSSFLHTFISYTFFGSSLAFLLSYLLIRVMRLEDVASKIRLMYLTLTIPLLAYAVWHVILPGLHVYPAIAPANPYLVSFFNIACQVGYWGSFLFKPAAALVAAAMVIRYALGVMVVCRLVKRNSLDPRDEGLEYELHVLVRTLCQQAGVAIPRIVLLDRPYCQAWTCGLLHPVVVLTTGLVEQLDRLELEAVLAHEIAHIKRKDYLTNWITAVLKDVTFFNPVSYWAATVLKTEQEKAADDLAVSFTGKPLVYGSTLIKVWRKTKEQLAPGVPVASTIPSSSFLTGRGTVALRVERIIEPPQVKIRGSRSLLAFVLILVNVGMVLAMVC